MFASFDLFTKLFENISDQIKVFLTKMIPLICCKNCGFTRQAELSKKRFDKFEKCLNCKKDQRSYSYEIREYYNIKFQLIVFVNAIIVLVSVYFQIASLLLNEFTNFFAIYLIIDQSLIRFKNFYYRSFVVLVFMYYFWKMSFFHFIKFLLILSVSVAEIFKVNKVIIKSIISSKYPN
jgi:hypothetical protein